jgi:hypothetical protein
MPPTASAQTRTGTRVAGREVEDGDVANPREAAGEGSAKKKSGKMSEGRSRDGFVKTLWSVRQATPGRQRGL